MLSARIILTILPAILAAGLPGHVTAERIAYHDGTELPGTILRIDGETVHVLVSEDDSATGEAGASRGGEDSGPETRTVALYEIGAMHFQATAGDPPPGAIEDVAGPAVCFRSGQLLPGNVAATHAGDAASGAGQLLRVESGDATIDVPLELLWGFRLQRPYRGDERFRADLAAAVRAASALPRSNLVPEDWIYVVRGRQLLKIGGAFRSLDGDFLYMDYQGRTRRVPRSRVVGAILAPVAARGGESGYPAVVRLTSGGEFPAFVAGMERPEADRPRLLFRFRGSPPESRQSIAIERVQQVLFFSDRVAFLSDLAPIRTRETPLVGSKTAFPWRKDRATTGGPLTLAGKTYRKGLGVHSYSSLEFDIAGRYSTFAATIGLVDLDPKLTELSELPLAQAGVTFRVLADDKVLFEKDITRAADRSAEAEKVVLPMTGVERLRLEVDYGKDGVDFSDHAAWAEARVIRE